MIEALKRLRAALFLPADLHAAMRAGVEQRARLAFAVPCEQDATPGNIPGQEVAGPRQLRAVPEIEPAVREYPLLFCGQDFGIDEVAPGDLEEALRMTDQNS